MIKHLVNDLKSLYLHSTYYAPGTLLITLHILTHLIFARTQRGGFCYHLICNKAKAWQGQVIPPVNRELDSKDLC